MSNLPKFSRLMDATAAGPIIPAAGDYPTTFDYYIDPSLAPVAVETTSGLATGTAWSWRALYTKAATYAGRRIGIMDGTLTFNVGGLKSDGIAIGNNQNWIVVPSTAAGAEICAVNKLHFDITEGSHPQLGGVFFLRVMAANVTIRGIRFHGGGCQCIELLGALNPLIVDCQFDHMDCELAQPGVAQTNYGCIRTGNTTTPQTIAAACRNLIVRNCRFDTIYNTRTSGGSVFADDDPGAWGGGIGQLFANQDVLVEFCTFHRVGHCLSTKRNIGNVIYRFNLTLEVEVALTYITMMDNLTPTQKLAAGETAGNSSEKFAFNPTLVYKNIFADVTSSISGGNTGEVESNWHEAHMYNNAFLFRNDVASDPVAGTGHMMYWNQGAQFSGHAGLPGTVPAPFPVANMQFYNNIMGFSAPSVPHKPAHRYVPGPGLNRGATSPGNSASDLFAVLDYNIYCDGYKSVDVSNGRTYTAISGGGAADIDAALGLETNSLIAAHGMLNPTTTNPADYVLQPGAAALGAGLGGVDIGPFDGVLLYTIGADFALAV